MRVVPLRSGECDHAEGIAGVHHGRHHLEEGQPGPARYHLVDVGERVEVEERAQAAGVADVGQGVAQVLKIVFDLGRSHGQQRIQRGHVARHFVRAQVESDASGRQVAKRSRAAR